jgi:hypothetical protein
MADPTPVAQYALKPRIEWKNYEIFMLRLEGVWANLHLDSRFCLSHSRMCILEALI